MSNSPGTEKRFAIILQAGAETHEGMARALHALLYARELSERGATCRLIFDGAGSEWAAKLLAPESDPERRMARLFEGMRSQGIAYEVCDYCSGAFQVREKLQAAGAPLSGAYMDHPSIADLVLDGYQLVVL